MLKIPNDIFTEPDDFSLDTLANLGPLRRLAGGWQSDEGSISTRKQRAPNGACSANISAWSRSIRSPTAWEPATGLMQTIAIPRGQVVLAGGTVAPDNKRISLEGRRGDTPVSTGSVTPR